MRVFVVYYNDYESIQYAGISASMAYASLRACDSVQVWEEGELVTELDPKAFKAVFVDA